MAKHKIRRRKGKFKLSKPLILLGVFVVLTLSIMLNARITGYVSGEDELMSVPIEYQEQPTQSSEEELISLPTELQEQQTYSSEEEIISIPEQPTKEPEEQEIIISVPDEFFGTSAAPTHSQPTLNASSQYNYTTDNITCYNVSTADGDNNNITNIYNWYKNNDSIYKTYLSFDHDDSGGTNTTKDYSNRNNYWAIGSPADGDPAEPTWTMQGKIGGAYEFDGVNDTIRCNGCASTGSTTNLSIEAWIRANDTTLAIGTITERNCNWLFSLNTNKINFYTADLDGCMYHNQWTSSASVVQGAWTYVVATINSSDVSGRAKIYVNGVAGTTLTRYDSGWTNNNVNGTTIGTRAANPYVLQAFKGGIDEIRIYNYTLSPEQVYQRYIDTKNGYSANQTIVSNHVGLTGTNWTCEITPNDAISNGSPLNSSNLIMGIGTGSDTSVPYWLSNETNTSNSITTGQNAYYNITLYDYHAGGSYIFGYYNSTDWLNETGTWTNSQEITHNKTVTEAGGTTIQYMWWFNDSGGNSNSTPVWSFTMVSPPTHSQPVLNATTQYNQTIDNITCYNVSTADADGNTVTNIYNWYKNNKSIMVVNLPFDHDDSGGAGKTKDYSGSGNNGTETTVTWNSTGKVGGAYEFNGSTDYITITDANSLDLRVNFSIEVWIKPRLCTSSGSVREISSKGAAYYFAIKGDGSADNCKLTSYMYGVTPQAWHNSKDPLTLNEWSHVVLVYNGSHKLFYINGTLNNLTAATGNVDVNANNLVIGDVVSGVNRRFNGTMDEYRLYNVSLTANQIYQRYIDTKNSHSSNETIVSGITSGAGTNWTCEVTPNDGSRDGIARNSSMLTIQATDLTSPIMIFINPSPGNASREKNNSVTINATVTDDISVDTCILQWNGTNETMTKVGTGSSVICNSSKVTFDANNYTYQIFANDSRDRWNSTEVRMFVENNKTYLNSTTIHPISPSDADNLVCNATNYTDFENDAISYYYYWTNGSTVIRTSNITSTTHTLYAGNTTANEVWNCTIIPTDGYENGTNKSASYNLTDGTKPYWLSNETNATSGSLLTGQNAYYNITLYDVVSGGTYIFGYYNSTDWLNETGVWSNSQEITHNKTVTETGGTTIQYMWWFNDSAGNTNSTPVWSVVLQQFAPNVTFQELYPATPVVTDDLVLNVTCIDGEHTSLTAAWNIFKNNVNQTSLTGSAALNNGTNANIFTILSGNLSGGDVWKALVWCSDSFDWSTNGTTSKRVIRSTNVPTQTQPLMQSSTFDNLTEDNLTCFNQSSADADGETIVNTYGWYRNYTPVMLLNLPFNGEYSGGTNVTKDYSGNNFSGQLGSSASGDSAEPTWTSSGKVGGAYVFDGIDDRIDFSQSTLDIGKSSINYTLQINSTTTGLKYQTYGMILKNDSNNILYFRRMAYNHSGTEGVLIMNVYNIANRSWSPLSVIHNDTNTSISDANSVGGGIIGNNIYVFFSKQDFTGVTLIAAGIGYIKSTDLSGTSWSSYNSLDVSPLTGYAPYGHLANTSDSSTFLQPFYGNNGSYYWVKAFKTTDNGQTWTVGPTLYNGTSALSETDIEYIGNGKLIAHSRLNSGVVLKQSTSSDDGQIWSTYATTNLGALTGTSEKIPWLLYDSETGKIIALFMDRASSIIRLSETDVDVAFANASNWEYSKNGHNDGTILGYPSIVKTGTNTYFYVYDDCPSSTDCDTWGGYYTYQPRMGITTSAWIKANIAGMDNSRGVILARSKGDGEENGFFLRFNDLDDTNSMDFRVHKYYEDWCEVLASDAIGDNNWHHVAAVFNETNNTLQVYIDGALNASAYCGWATLDSARIMRAGAMPSTTPGTQLFNGTLDEIKLYNAPLSPSQVYQLYTDTKDGHSQNQTIVAEETDSAGENWTCEVIPSDSSQDGIAQNSTLMIIENITPYWSNKGTNASDTITVGQNAFYNITLHDNYAGGSYIFGYYDSTSWLNETGTWTNDQTILHNKTITEAVGTTIQYMWWFNDSFGNSNSTSILSFTVAQTVTPTTLTTETTAPTGSLGYFEGGKCENLEMLPIGTNFVNVGRTIQMPITLVNKGDSDAADFTISVKKCPFGWKCSSAKIEKIAKKSNKTVNLEITPFVFASSENYGLDIIVAGKPNCTITKYATLAVGPECYSAEDCSEGFACLSYRCTKLFDVKITSTDYLVSPGEKFDFTYFIKNMADEGGDVEVKFWLGDEGKEIIVGSDTIYIGEREEITENVSIFLPTTVAEGVYKFYVRANYMQHSVTAYRTVQVLERHTRSAYWLIIFIVSALLLSFLVWHNRPKSRYTEVLRYRPKVRIRRIVRKIRLSDYFVGHYHPKFKYSRFSRKGRILRSYYRPKEKDIKISRKSTEDDFRNMMKKLEQDLGKL